MEKQNLFNIAIFDIGIGERICVSLTDVTTSGILDGNVVGCAGRGSCRGKEIMCGKTYSILVSESEN